MDDMVHKGPRDYQTAADRAVEQQIVEALVLAFPDFAISGEEQIGDRAGSGKNTPLAHIDPIDGTTNFAWGIPHFGIVHRR